MSDESDSKALSIDEAALRLVAPILLQHVGLASTNDFENDIKRLYKYIYNDANDVVREHIFEMMQV